MYGFRSFAPRIGNGELPHKPVIPICFGSGFVAGMEGLRFNCSTALILLPSYRKQLQLSPSENHQSSQVYNSRRERFTGHRRLSYEKFGGENGSSNRTRMLILCDVNRAECLRYGIAAPSSVVAVEINPKLLTQDQRNFIVENLYEHLRFPKDEESSICPPTYAGLISSVNYGLQCEQEQRTQRIRGGSINLEPEKITKLAECRHKAIKSAIAEDNKTQRSKID